MTFDPFVDKDYDYINSKYIGSTYGDMRRERSALMKRLCHDSDATVKPRIREITMQMQEYMKHETLHSST